MINVTISLPDDVKDALELRMRESGHAEVVDYLRDLVWWDLSAGDAWEMTPELAALLEEGERSGVSSRSLDEIFAEARQQFVAEQK